jgi:hypothetical protein
MAFIALVAFTIATSAAANAASERSRGTAPDDRAPAPAQGAACGGPGLPPCPLQGWMRANIAAPLAANNSAALAVGLERAAGLNPDASWSSWSAIAMQGAAAAKKGDIAGARAACKGCHDAWREAYRKKYRSRPIPR